ncbi:MAG: ABA4-like family protein [Cyanobacteriota bacterium]|nr:ABA4-like family protein [Cyanobacteriota bacterium]
MWVTITALFNGANLFVLPFWTLAIVFPNWGVTKKVMESLLPFVALAILYIYLIVGTLDTEAAKALANPQLADIARFFADERAAATGWAHFLVMDLFVGRWIYWEGQRTGVWTTHSLILCLFAGPLGLLSHIATSWVSKQLGSEEAEQVSV